MVVKVRAISSQTSQDIARTFAERAAELRSAVAARIADDIVDFSPVDTGTYIMSHVASVDGAAGTDVRTSHGKTRGRDPGQFRNLARGNLRRSVAKEALLHSADVFFVNRSAHASRVEYDGWYAPLFGNPNSPRRAVPAYHVYAQAKARVGEHIDAVARAMGMTTR